MLKKKAFLFGDIVELDQEYIYELIQTFINEFMECGKESELNIPTIIKGEFHGYIDRGGWPIGTFYAADGRIFIASVEKTVDVTDMEMEMSEEIGVLAVH